MIKAETMEQAAFEIMSRAAIDIPDDYKSGIRGMIDKKLLGNKTGGGFYRNSATGGRWADYIAEDLIGHIDATFRTMDSPSHRAVVGHSMGGLVSLLHEATYPGRVGKLVVIDSTLRAAPERVSMLHQIGNREGSSYATREEFIARFSANASKSRQATSRRKFGRFAASTAPLRSRMRPRFGATATMEMRFSSALAR